MQRAIVDMGFILKRCVGGCAGGRGVIEGLGGQLGLSRKQVEPSFNSLYWCAHPCHCSKQLIS